MTDRPIIFSAPMVRALLDGRKTMTRRLPPQWLRCFSSSGRLRPFTPALFAQAMKGRDDIKTLRIDGRVGFRWQSDPVHEGHHGRPVWYAEPVVQPGDRLWVREAHYVESAGFRDGTGRRINYRATTPDAPNTWTSSIHMPRWASRLTLVVAAVKIEKLQAISEADAIAEGMAPVSIDDWDDAAKARIAPATRLWEHSSLKKRGRQCSAWQFAVQAFRELWGDLHGPRSCDANPEVVALAFAVHRCNIDAMAPAA